MLHPVRDYRRLTRINGVISNGFTLSAYCLEIIRLIGVNQHYFRTQVVVGSTGWQIE